MFMNLNFQKQNSIIIFEFSKKYSKYFEKYKINFNIIKFILNFFKLNYLIEF